MASSVIEKIEFLYNKARKVPETTSEYAVNSVKLIEDGILILRYDFESPPPQGLNPPLLFARYAGFTKEHGIDKDGFDSSEEMEQYLHYPEFKPGERWMDAMTRVTYVKHYLMGWATGGQIARKMPSGYVDLLMYRNISLIKYLTFYSNALRSK